MLEIWWVRHGSTDWNAEKRWQGFTNVKLNELGRSQARMLEPKLKGIHFHEIWSSDLDRAVETASIALPGQKIRTDCRLREIPMGVVEGRTWTEISQKDRDDISDWWVSPYKRVFPGTNETLTDVTNRVNAWRLERPKDGRIICFTHGGIVRTMIWDMVGHDSSKKWTMELGNTGIVRIRYQDDCKTLVAFNDMSHFSDYWEFPPCQNVPGS